jgi:hypothetical protein
MVFTPESLPNLEGRVYLVTGGNAGMYDYQVITENLVSQADISKVVSTQHYSSLLTMQKSTLVQDLKRKVKLLPNK